MEIREATEKWVEGMNAYPLRMISNLMSFTPEEWKELTPPSVGNRVYAYESQSEGTVKTVLGDGVYDVELDDGQTLPISAQDMEVEYEDGLPMWGTMWAFDSEFDNEWLTNHLQTMADCGFRIFESEEFGYFFGIDGAGYDFYENHWIPLYKARGLHWHIED